MYAAINLCNLLYWLSMIFFYVCTVNFTNFFNASTVLGGTENFINSKQVYQVPLKLNAKILRENCRQTEEFVWIVWIKRSFNSDMQNALKSYILQAGMTKCKFTYFKRDM